MNKYFFSFFLFFIQYNFGSARLNLPNISFEDSMKKSYSWNNTYSIRSKKWIILRKLYNENFLYNIQVSKTPRIPKIIHWVWFGSPLPEKYKKLQDGWKKLHQDWEFKLWTDESLKTFKFENDLLKTFFDKAKNLAQKSDIFRLLVLKKFGGLYLDTDFSAIKSFELLHYICDFYTGIGYGSLEPCLYNGLIASAPNHPMIEYYMENIIVSGSNDPRVIMNETGPILFTKIFFQYINYLDKNNIIAFPVTFFYPLSNIDRHDNDQKIRARIKPESYAIHYYHTSWVK